MSTLLSDHELALKLAALPRWRREGNELVTEVRFTSYMAGILFVNEVAAAAERMNHHPAIEVGWRRVALRLSTHSAGGLTDKDFALAAAIGPLFPDACG